MIAFPAARKRQRQSQLLYRAEIAVEPIERFLDDHIPKDGMEVGVAIVQVEHEFTRVGGSS